MAQLAVAAALGIGQLYQGRQIKKLKDKEAEGYMDAAGRRRAAAHREMSEEQRKKEFMHSRAIAVAAAQSGNTSDPGIVRLLGDLNAEGEYRILARLWAGENEAEGLEFCAEAARREGDAAVGASYINAVTSALSGYAGMGGFSSKAPASSGVSLKAAYDAGSLIDSPGTQIPTAGSYA